MTRALQVPPEEMPLTPAQATAVFRIFQEALTNVVRHATASHVEVHVTQNRRAVRLAVADNGIGITPAKQRELQGLGLLGMRERAQLWGGTVTIKSQSGRGTTVTVRMPYRATAKGEIFV